MIMGRIKYTGTDDFRVLAASDFKSLGVEHKKTTFERGQEVEVPDEVAKALIDLGEFSAEEAGPDPIEGTEVATDKNSPSPEQTGIESTGGTTAAGASKRSSTTRTN